MTRSRSSPLDFETLHAELKYALSRSPEVRSPESEARLVVFYLLRKHGAPAANLNELEPKFASLSLEAREALASEAQALAEQRLKGRLLQHLTGEQCFLDHDYLVSPAVLIPRPETEILASHAIEWMKKRMREGRSPGDSGMERSAPRFAELGLGSGILSCELLSALPSLTGVASERSEAAIEIAKLNLKNIVGENWSERLRILRAPTPETGFELFLPSGPFDLIVSNPPYLGGEDEIEAQVLREEPKAALFAEGPVNHFYQNFASHAHELLVPGGRAYLEVPHERALEIEALIVQPGFETHLLNDLSGRPRVLKFSKCK